MNEKEIFFQILGRYMDNFFVGMQNPVMNLFAEPVKNWVFNFVDPYLNAFFVSDSNKINSKAAEQFLKSEVNEKIEKFMKEFNDARENE